MDNKTLTVFDQLTDRPIALFPCFTKSAGSLAGGVLLAQLLYWDKAMNGAEFYKTDRELIEETGLSRHEFRAAKARLCKLGFIKTVLRRSPAITHYQVCKSEVIEAISRLPKSGKLDCRDSDNKIAEIRQTGLPKSGQHIHTENTTEITPDINPPPPAREKKNSKPTPTPKPAPARDPGLPGSPEEMQRQEWRETVSRFLDYAEKSHAEIRGTPLILRQEDINKVTRLVSVNALSFDVLKDAWEVFVRDASGWVAKHGKPRNIWWFDNQIQDYLDRSNALQKEALREAERRKKLAEESEVWDKVLESRSIVPDDEAAAFWAKVLDKVEPQLIPENFNNWFISSYGVSLSRETLVVSVPNRFYKKCLDMNYLELVENTIKGMGLNPPPKVEFIHGVELAYA